MMEMELSVQKAKENNIDIEECYKKAWCEEDRKRNI